MFGSNITVPTTSQRARRTCKYAAASSKAFAHTCALALLVLCCLAEGRGGRVNFCVQDLPSQFNLDIGKRQLEGGSNHFNRFESPFGELLSANGAIWSTNQFCLDYWFFHQMTRWRHKTSCEQADVVYVPFLMAQVGHDDIASQAWRDFDKSLPQLLPLVREKPHLLVFPRTEWVTRHILNDSWHLFDHNMEYNLTYLTLEVFKPVWKDQGPLRNILSMPYPSWWHFHDGLQIEPFDTQAAQSKKTLLAIQSFDPRYPFRARLKAACLSIPAICHHYEFSYWSQSNATAVSNWLTETAAAWFCVNPPGDSPTRKAIFDCIVSGTIPVVFDHWVPYTFPYNDVLNASDFMVLLSESWTEATALEGIYAEHLARISVDERLAKLKVIHQLRQVFQYSLTPHTGEIRFDNLRVTQSGDDALTFSLKAAVRNMCARGLFNMTC